MLANIIIYVIIAVSSRGAAMGSLTDGNTNYTEALVLSHNMVKRSSIPPNTPCSDSNEGLIKQDSTSQYLIWICKSGEWIPYQIEPSLGKVKSLTAHSCKHIKEILTTNCNNVPTSGLYWVWKKKPMQVYCDMETDGGGWTLVWTHSYLETLPLSTNMYYYSHYYKSCTTYTSGWCNIPNKKHFNPTEQMIVAYHEGTIVYAYKGIFNYNIDHYWTGGVLVDFKKIIDKCTRSESASIQPAPSTSRNDHRLLGLAFDKMSPYNYFKNCDTIDGTLNSPGDCRWGDCNYPRYQAQQTMAIYVR